MFEKIKELAEKKKISLTELSLKMGWASKAIYNWRNTNPSIDKVKKVADYLGVTVDYLLEGDDVNRSIQYDLDRLINGLDGIAYSKDVEEMSDTTKELLIASLEQAAKIAKLDADKKK